MPDDTGRSDLTTGAATTAASRGPGLFGSIAHRLAGDAAELPIEGQLASFDRATGWLNSEPLTPEGLRGRLVLVDFWTYTCVNWLRTLPYLRAWDARYRSHGLTVIGVHTPEFEFEHNVDNVIAQSRSFGVEYPIAVDTDYGVWRAFGNHFWPAIYLADAEGRIRFRHFGEGEYAMTEMAIQQLLLDAGAIGVGPGLVSVDPRGLEVAADYGTLRSPETYLGYGQATGFASADGLHEDQAHDYAAPVTLGLNDWAPTGTWTITKRAAVLAQPGGRIAFRFQARDVNLVMGPAQGRTAVPFRVRLDGLPTIAAHGTDVGADGNGTATEQRTYQLIRQPDPIGERTFEIEFLDAGIEAYCFTFG
jgi:thiol-disulfide isomerase/thioredoxin